MASAEVILQGYRVTGKKKAFSQNARLLSLFIEGKYLTKKENISLLSMTVSTLTFLCIPSKHLSNIFGKELKVEFCVCSICMQLASNYMHMIPFNAAN